MTPQRIVSILRMICTLSEGLAALQVIIQRWTQRPA